MTDATTCLPHLLIVDDDPIVSMLHKRVTMKTALAGNVQVFGNGKLALDHIREHCDAGHQHLVLLDINMPVMDGWEMLEALQELDCAAQVRVVMVTSSLDENDEKRARKYPQVAGYITKPLRKESIDALLRKPEIKAFAEAVEAYKQD